MPFMWIQAGYNNYFNINTKVGEWMILTEKYKSSPVLEFKLDNYYFNTNNKNIISIN